MTERASLSRTARSILAVEHLVRITRRLEREAIRVMPLKGVLLQAAVYREREERPVTDLDVLVPSEDLSRALTALESDGYEVLPEVGGDAARDLLRADNPVRVDLHGRLFPDGMFRLSAGDVFSRARPDRELFAVPVWVPDPYDLFAHLIGHFAAGRLSRRDVVHARDFGVVARHYEMDARRAAQHLDRHGLSRAARYALSVAADATGDAEPLAVLDALPRDPIGSAVAGLARTTFDNARAGSPLGIVPSHLLNRSLPAAVASLSRRTWRVARLAAVYGRWPRKERKRAARKR